MTFATKQEIKTLGNYAYSAIQKHSQKTIKLETPVKKDKDPEALHQMRVGMRRLRTAVTGFSPAVDLQKPASDKNIGKIARTLGNLRDLDVLKETLEKLEQSHLPRKEKHSLQTALDALSKQREEALVDVKSTFKDERYKSLKHTLKEWLEEPSYQPLAYMPIQQVLPDLLLPEVSKFLLHPGWLIGTQVEGQVEEAEVIIPGKWEAQRVEQELATNGDTLHSLRKQAKRLRYQMELFTDLYGQSYTACLAEVKSIQEILGAIQDSVVLTQWLADVFNSEIRSQFPTLASWLAQNRCKLWQQWQPLQRRYLKAQTRHGFHLTMLHPA
ncbi:CHAD domain-containing protein [Brasilonema sp. UFV-L1]|uniref:CHAD domain-containing protein n=1 Tax=Brasilonema sp. UFV-L1 TaxID=2234130 RepID=UPI00145C3F58|nr:CHAD domain-containing protein [Brasilonema sp. UFV-L1]NMG10034.1 CHAD domain-containing protein [Brasilonema sp. UFV-L1]